MAYDSHREVVVLFGGSDRDDTWEWDGETWTERTTPTSPPGRRFHGMAYDPIRQRTVVFGGVEGAGATGLKSDTWEWDGDAWTEVVTADSPLPRYGAQFTYHSVARRIILFGGTDYVDYMDDTWSYDGQNWILMQPAVPPSARCCGASVDAPSHDGTLLFGGQITSPTGALQTPSNETWLFLYEPPECGDGVVEGYETCDDGNTVDGDGCSATCQTPDWVPPGLALAGPCAAGQTDCSFTVDDDAETLDALQRIYRGASLYYRTPYLNVNGAVLPHQFPSDQGITPIEGTCCSTGGLPGPDFDGNDLCDWSPNIWNTDPWNALGFNFHTGPCVKEWDETCGADQYAYVYDFTSEGTQDAATFTVKARTMVGCDWCKEAEISMSAHVDPSWAADEVVAGQAVCTEGCNLLPPDTFEVTAPTDCDVAPIVGQVILTEAQKAGFLPAAGAVSVHPWWDEVTTNLEAILQGAVDAFEASDPSACAFPESGGTTPIEGSCCSTGGLPGWDENQNDLCDVVDWGWSNAPWTTLGFKPEVEHGFVYWYRTEGTGLDARVIATANADLDCDGIQSTFMRMAFLSPDPGTHAAGLPDGLAPGSCQPVGGDASWSEAIPPYLYVERLIE